MAMTVDGCFLDGGVRASFNGGEVWLSDVNSTVPDIRLTPKAFAALVQFEAECRSKAAKRKDEEESHANNGDSA